MNIHCCCSIVFQLAECGALTTAASDDALVEQPGSDDLQPEALEGSSDCGDGMDAATQIVKSRSFLKCDLLRFLRPLSLLTRLSSSQQRVTDEEVDQLERRRRWEAGQADYLGKDAFRNIQKMLDRFLD